MNDTQSYPENWKMLLAVITNQPVDMRVEVTTFASGMACLHVLGSVAPTSSVNAYLSQVVQASERLGIPYVLGPPWSIYFFWKPTLTPAHCLSNGDEIHPYESFCKFLDTELATLKHELTARLGAAMQDACYIGIAARPTLPLTDAKEIFIAGRRSRDRTLATEWLNAYPALEQDDRAWEQFRLETEEENRRKQE